jgi:hypothetical protein
MTTSPITDRERLIWQRRAVRVLAGLLEHAHHDSLPVVGWTVAHAGAALVARCFAHDPARRRSEFNAWCVALGATVWPERASGSTTHLHAIAEHYDGLVTVTVLADLVDEGGGAA